MAKEITKASIYNEKARTRIDFDTIKFNSKVWEKGYDIEWYKMIICPCRKDTTSQAVSNCVNCNGLGYYWFDKKETRGLISGASLSKRQLMWSEVLEGSIYLSVDSEFKLGWYDKIIVKTAQTVFTESAIVQSVGLDKLIYTKYVPLKLIKLFKYNNEHVQLTEISSVNCTIENNIIKIIDNNVSVGNNISILYEYNPTYLVIDLLNDYRNTFEKNRKPKETLEQAPIRVLAKKLHLTI